MTPPKFVLYLIGLLLGEMAQATELKSSPSLRQERHFVSANVGDDVTLHCFYDGEDSAWLYWYKQTLGQKPKLISTTYVYDTRTTFYHELNNNPRFTLQSGNRTNHLTIFNLDISDSATYYCARSYTFIFEFAAGTTVSVKNLGLNIPVLVDQSAFETIQPGGSVTLNCTVQTGSCDGVHSVYWFKYSEESHPGLIYSHGGRNDQCERKAITKTHTCFYNLPMKSLNLSHAGTYYCAVASCGHILFGDGTKLDIVDGSDSHDSLVYLLSGALAITTILVVLLAFSVYMMNKRKSCQCTECGRVPASTATNEGYQDADDLHYAALRDHKANRSRKQRDDTKSECVYSRVKL